jgi:hypothetical protein
MKFSNSFVLLEYFPKSGQNFSGKNHENIPDLKGSKAQEKTNYCLQKTKK